MIWIPPFRQGFKYTPFSHRQTNRRTDGRTDRQTDGRTDRQKVIVKEKTEGGGVSLYVYVSLLVWIINALSESLKNMIAVVRTLLNKYEVINICTVVLRKFSGEKSYNWKRWIILLLIALTVCNDVTWPLHHAPWTKTFKSLLDRIITLK